MLEFDDEMNGRLRKAAKEATGDTVEIRITDLKTTLGVFDNLSSRVDALASRISNMENVMGVLDCPNLLGEMDDIRSVIWDYLKATYPADPHPTLNEKDIQEIATRLGLTNGGRRK